MKKLLRMRLFTKFYALCALALCSILFSGGFLASQHYYRRVVLSEPAPEGGSEERPAIDRPAVNRRLVVFGDSWSDSNAAPIKGSVWTDHLCSKLSCEQENLAQTAKSAQGNYIGSVVDNAELNSIGTLFGLYRTPVADFKHQAREWLGAESEASKTLLHSSDDLIRQRRNNTVFVVSFGIWDIWNLVGTDYEKATASVDRSIAALMQQLDLLSEGWRPRDFRVVLTLSPDVTYFPAFRSISNKDLNRQKETVRIVQYWNDRLRDAALPWAHGTVYLFDTNAFMIGLIRDWEFSVAGTEEDRLGVSSDPGWENVDDPCVTTRQQWVVMADEVQCENPEKYLFWNEMHLGASAHRLMGTEVFQRIEEMWLRQK